MGSDQPERPPNRPFRPGTFTPGMNPAIGSVWRPNGESLVERRIREATERGEFDVPSKGRRIDLGNTDDPDWWLKRYVAREGIDMADALPAPLALRREAERFPESLADLTDADQVRAVLQDYNRRVVAEWRRPRTDRDLPVVPHQVDVEGTVERWQALRAQRPAVPEPVVEDLPHGSGRGRRRSRSLFGIRLRRRVDPLRD